MPKAGDSPGTDGGRGDNDDTETKTFGITSNRFRGFVILVFLAVAIYAVLFENDPPPMFDEVKITVAEKPVPDFDERTIILPDFRDSPVGQETEQGEGVEISVAAPAKSPAPEPVKVEIAEKGTGGNGQQAVAAVEDAPAPDTPVQGQRDEPEPEPSAAVTDAKGQDTQPARVNVGDYSVQVAALKSEDSANELGAVLAEALGEPFYVQPVDSTNGRLYRVRLGPYESRSQAEGTLAELNEVDPQIGAGSYVDLE